MVTATTATVGWKWHARTRPSRGRRGAVAGVVRSGVTGHPTSVHPGGARETGYGGCPGAGLPWVGRRMPDRGGEQRCTGCATGWRRGAGVRVTRRPVRPAQGGDGDPESDGAPRSAYPTGPTGPAGGRHRRGGARRRPRPRPARRRRSRHRPPRHLVPGLPGRQRVEHAGHRAARGRRERHLARLHGRVHHVPPPGLRPVVPPDQALRHPVGDRPDGDTVRPDQVHLRLGERPRPLPAVRRHADRGRLGPPRPDGGSDHLHAVRDLRHPLPPAQEVEGGLGRHLEPGLRRAAPGRVDIGRRRRAARPARPGQLRRGGLGSHGPRHPVHGGLHPGVLPLAGAPRSGPSGRLVPAHGGPVPPRPRPSPCPPRRARRSARRSSPP